MNSESYLSEPSSVIKLGRFVTHWYVSVMISGDRRLSRKPVNGNGGCLYSCRGKQHICQHQNQKRRLCLVISIHVLQCIYVTCHPCRDFVFFIARWAAMIAHILSVISSHPLWIVHPSADQNLQGRGPGPAPCGDRVTVQIEEDVGSSVDSSPRELGMFWSSSRWIWGENLQEQGCSFRSMYHNFTTGTL